MSGFIDLIDLNCEVLNCICCPYWAQRVMTGIVKSVLIDLIDLNYEVLYCIWTLRVMTGIVKSNLIDLIDLIDLNWEVLILTLLFLEVLNSNPDTCTDSYVTQESPFTE